MTSLFRVVTLSAALGGSLLGGCSGGEGPSDAVVRCPLGDPAAPAQLEVVHMTSDLQVVPTLDGARVPLHAPPQGGWILLLGVRATNIDGCQLTLTTSFREACDGPVIKVDRRPARLTDTGDGWGISTTSTFGNLPVCPQLTSLRDLHEQPYDVTVELEDADGKRASRTLNLTPTCPPDERCTCECDHNYVLGGACPAVGPDAGVPACPDAAP